MESVGATPDPGYLIGTVKLDGQTQTVPNRSGYTLHLNDVRADHTITVTFSAIKLGFSDVTTTNPYYEAIQGMAATGIIGGYGDGTFRPHEYVAAAYANGITQGLTATTFGPWESISRAQVVTMVIRALQNLHPGWLLSVPGAYLNTWGTEFSPTHGPNSRIAEYNGLLAGLPLDGAANDPWAPMSRGEVAQVLWNMMKMQD